MGQKIPARSESRPMKMPPKPNPIIVSVYGMDASARATPKSACTAGSATTTDHMPTPPMVDNISVTRRRIHAYDDSGSSRDGKAVGRAVGALPESFIREPWEVAHWQ